MASPDVSVPPVVSFLSDFGLQDHFVGVCHGVVLSHAPEARIVDLTHDVPPQDVMVGALLLARSVPYFPPRSVHLVVVDPGVGTTRHAVAVETDRGDLLVGPDNGLLSPAIDALGGLAAAVVLPVPTDASATFHGRDVFSPAAGRLAAGVPLAELGRRLEDDLRALEVPAPRRRSADPSTGRDHDELQVTVLLVDRFGNCQLNLRPADLPGVQEVRVGSDGPVAPVRRTFSDLDPGQLGLITDSDGLLALTVREGSAAAELGLSPHAELGLRFDT